MSNSFDKSLSTYNDYIRFATDDTDDDYPLVLDETITALVTAYGFAGALAAICDHLIIHYAQMPDYFQIHYTEELQWKSRIKAWQELRDLARAGLIPDPILTGPNALMVALQHTHLQRDTPKRPVPSVEPFGGPLAGYRSN